MPFQLAFCNSSRFTGLQPSICLNFSHLLGSSSLSRLSKYSVELKLLVDEAELEAFVVDEVLAASVFGSLDDVTDVTVEFELVAELVTRVLALFDAFVPEEATEEATALDEIDTHFMEEFKSANVLSDDSSEFSCRNALPGPLLDFLLTLKMFFFFI